MSERIFHVPFKAMLSYIGTATPPKGWNEGW